MSGLTKNPLASLAALGLAGMAPSNTGGLNPTGIRFLKIFKVFYYMYICIYILALDGFRVRIPQIQAAIFNTLHGHHIQNTIFYLEILYAIY